MGPRHGDEYILIAVASSSSIIFNRRKTAYFANFLCLGVFIAIKVYHFSHPFVPNPVINYTILPAAILLGTVAVLSFQMAFFRDLVHHYDNKLSTKYKELNDAMERQQLTDEELMATNEELTSSNEQLYSLSKQLEGIVRQKSAELQSYIDAINVNIYSVIINANGTIVKVNEPLLQASGYLEEELLGRSFNMLNAEDYSSSYLSYFKGHNPLSRTWRGEIINKRKDGSFFWTDMVILPVMSADDSINYFLTLSLPITERKQHAESREKTIKLIETVAFKTSHAIRGPLTRIQGLTNLIQNDHVTVKEFKALADKILDGSQEINTVTTELVKFVNAHQSSIQTGENKV
jgi:PAS domain S-box-containing protein